MVVARAWSQVDFFCRYFLISAKMHIFESSQPRRLIILLVLVGSWRVLRFRRFFIPQCKLFALALGVAWNSLLSRFKATLDIIAGYSSLVLVCI